MENKTQRMIWIVPNIFCYLLFIGVFVFITVNFAGLVEMQEIMRWVFVLLALLAVSLFGSVRIRRWIADGRI